MVVTEHVTSKHNTKPQFVKVQIQGSLVAAARQSPYRPSGSTSKRGAITAFSKRSRSRLLKKFATMDFKKGKFVFITLTYGAQYPAPHEAKQHLRAFLKRLSRLSAQKGRNGGFIWRLEFQDRGAPHFHIICTSLPFVPKTQIQSMWAEITGAEQPFTRIEMIRSKRGVMYYVSKYLAKTVQSGDKCSGGFIYVPYQATGSNHTEPEYDASILGRFWGVENERAIAYCEAAWFTTQSSPAFLIALKRMAAAEWLGINPYDGNGFTLYTRNAVDWFEKVLALLEYEDRWTLSRNRKSGLL